MIVKGFIEKAPLESGRCWNYITPELFKTGA
jgi:hypothetical protein